MRPYWSRPCPTHLLTTTSSMPCVLVLQAKATLRTLEDMLRKGLPLIRGSTVPAPRAHQHVVLKEVSYTSFHPSTPIIILI
jgi:hypothetical protein